MMSSVSQTVTLVEYLEDKIQKPKEEVKNEETSIQIIRLRPKLKKTVKFTEDTIDNENLGRLKSNSILCFDSIIYIFYYPSRYIVCCIYHKPREEKGAASTSTCTSDNSGNELERSRETKQRHKKKCSKLKKDNDKHKDHQCNHDHQTILNY